MLATTNSEPELALICINPTGMAETAEEPDEPDMQYEEEDVEPDTGVVGSSAMVDQFGK